jgi:hypothetical protein
LALSPRKSVLDKAPVMLREAERTDAMIAAVIERCVGIDVGK